jgi:hypothetical protein
MSNPIENLADTLGLSPEKRAMRAYLRNVKPPESPEAPEVSGSQRAIRVEHSKKEPVRFTTRVGLETWSFDVGYKISG